MQNDERDPRDWRQAGDEAAPDAPEPPPEGDTQPTEPTEPTEPGEAFDRAPAEPSPAEPSPAEPSAAEPSAAEPPAAEPSAWPSDAPERVTWPDADGGTAPDAYPPAAAETTPSDSSAASPATEAAEESWGAPADAESWQAPPPAEPMAAADSVAGAEPEEFEAPAAVSPPPPSEVEAFDETPAAGADATGVAAAAAAAHSVPATPVGESTQCPRCGTENRPGLAFCRNCGQRLVAAGVAPTIERPGTPEGTQACPRCGTHNRAGVAFCQNCGANLRPAAAGYVPPAVAAGEREAAAARERGGAVLGPIVLIIGAIGLATGWLLPFAYGPGSLYDRSFGSGGWGVQFWTGYADVPQTLADQAYFGFAAPTPLLAGILVLLGIGGFVRAKPGLIQRLGLLIALLWSVGLAVLFVVVEIGGNWGGELIAVLRDLSPGGIILFLAALIVLIGTLTRFGRG